MAGPGCRLLWLAVTAKCAAVTGKHFPGVDKEAAESEREREKSVCSVECQLVSVIILDGCVSMLTAQ